MRNSMLNKSVFLPVISILIFKALAVFSDNAERDFYAVGLKLSEEGQWEEALKTWWDGKIWMERLGKVDPRIGIAFIELTTEMSAKQFYGTASKLYLWGFSQDSPEYIQTVLEEAKRIEPLLEWEKRDAWAERIEDKDGSLWRDIFLYWLERDPRPSTYGNERLIEHWERIAHARRTFIKNRRGIYDCDDRGTIYVKYGNPDRQKNGRFGNSSASQIELKRWISEMVPIDIDTSDVFNMFRIVRDVNAYDYSPDYEVWAFDDIGSGDPSIFLFSHRGGVGFFGLVDGIESLYRKKRWIYTKDLGPVPTVFGEFTLRRQSIRPRDYLIYQIMYYYELASFDVFFDRRYSQLEQVWEANASHMRRTGVAGMQDAYARLLHSFEMRNSHTDKVFPTYQLADPDKSVFESNKGSITIDTHVIRLLDSNQPKLAVIVSSMPEFWQDRDIFGSGFLRPEYALRHTLIARDQALRSLGVTNHVIPPEYDDISYFMIDHHENIAHATIGAEAYGADNVVLALGRSSFHVKEPLIQDQTQIELSDLVVGVEPPRGIDLGQFPFPVFPIHEFTYQDTMKMYVEMYNMQLDQNTMARANIEYGVIRIKGHGDRQKREEQVSMIYPSEFRGRRHGEGLYVDISELKRGDYEFFVKVTDTFSKQEKTRTAPFTITR